MMANARLHILDDGHLFMVTCPGETAAIIEQFLEGVEVNCLTVARGSEVAVLTLSDRLRPGGAGFGVCLAHVFPATIDSDPNHSSSATIPRTLGP